MVILNGFKILNKVCLLFHEPGLFFAPVLFHFLTYLLEVLGFKMITWLEQFLNVLIISCLFLLFIVFLPSTFILTIIFISIIYRFTIFIGIVYIFLLFLLIFVPHLPMGIMATMDIEVYSSIITILKHRYVPVI